MIDIDEQVKVNGDINLIDSFIFKTRNLLKMLQGDDPYYPQTGISNDVIFTYKITAETINSYLSQYFGYNNITPLSIEILFEKQILSIIISESFAFIKIVDGVSVNQPINTKEVKHDVKLLA